MHEDNPMLQVVIANHPDMKEQNVWRRENMTSGEGGFEQVELRSTSSWLCVAIVSWLFEWLQINRTWKRR